MKENKEYEEFLKELDLGTGRYKKKDVFKDFIIILALGIDNKYYKNNESEKVACQIVEKYTNSERERFFLLSYKLKEMYNKKNEIVDILGYIYMQLNAQNKELGQDFTSYSITKCMTEQLEIDDKVIKEKGYMTLIEPSCRIRCINIINGKQTKNERI